MKPIWVIAVLMVLAAGQASSLRAAQTPPATSPLLPDESKPAPMPPQGVPSPQPPPSTRDGATNGPAADKESAPSSAGDTGSSPTAGKQESLVTVDWVG